MLSSQRHIYDIVSPGGDVSLMAMSDLKVLVDKYPYFHLARLALLRMLYQQRDPLFNDELRRSALYLPSRETIFEFVEGDKMRPNPDKDESSLFFGATLARKANERLQVAGEEDDRTESLIDSFLNSIPAAAQQGERTPVPQRRGRADATVDYISYMLAEEEETQLPAQESTEAVTATEATAPTTPPSSPAVDEPAVPTNAATAETEGEATVEKPAAETDSDEMIDNFIQKHGDRRIRLKDKKDSDLQKPVLDVDNASSKGAFTETLALIYIRQGKFEHAIEIIRRLSLKYPKKNRYFADQIRFLEKLIVNQNALKGKNV